MDGLRLFQLAIVGIGLLLIAPSLTMQRRGQPFPPARWALAIMALVSLGLAAVLVVQQFSTPLHLDVMEGVVLQHAQRAAFGLPIYAEPTPEFVALAYNPLYYVIAVPVSWVLGMNLTTLRLVAAFGMLGSVASIFLIVRRRTGSLWWGLLAAGLFAAAYRAMDSYLNTAHSDSWFLFCALLGTEFLDRNRSRRWNAAGVLLLVASFWFKQHGALFVVGGVLYATARAMREQGTARGLWGSLPYWLVAAVGGPGLYLTLGPQLFGPRFLYFTWEVPRSWSLFNLSTVYRFGRYVLDYFPLLAVFGAIYTILGEKLRPWWPNIWQVFFVVAGLTGMMGALDSGSADNVFIAMSAAFVLVGVLGLEATARQWASISRFGLHFIAAFVSFAALAYNPLPLLIPGGAQASYDDLLAMLKGVDGAVYAPDIGQLQAEYTLYPAAHWVALEDMIRGAGNSTANNPLVRSLLAVLEEPSAGAYLLLNQPLEELPLFAYLGESYVLETDFGERFAALRLPPKRFEHGYPRYLYRFVGENAAG